MPTYIREECTVHFTWNQISILPSSPVMFAISPKIINNMMMMMASHIKYLYGREASRKFMHNGCIIYLKMLFCVISLPTFTNEIHYYEHNNHCIVNWKQVTDAEVVVTRKLWNMSVNDVVFIQCWHRERQIERSVCMWLPWHVIVGSR